jgi:hypothetical protein
MENGVSSTCIAACLVKRAHPLSGSFFYTVLRIWMIAVGLGCGAINLAATQFQSIVLPESILPSFFTVAFVLIPPVLVAFLGPKTCFTLVARWFEYSLQRLLQDGSLMAELVSGSSVVDVGTMTRWVFRRSRSPHLEELFSEAPEGSVKRQFWMKGTIVSMKTAESGEASELTVVIDMAQDVDPTWSATYRGKVLCIDSLPHSEYGRHGELASPRTISDAAFERWIEENIPEELIIASDPTSKRVTLRVTVGYSASSSREVLRDWAVNNLRSLWWSDFSDDLLHVSPREIGSYEAKARVFAKSRKTMVREGWQERFRGIVAPGVCHAGPEQGGHDPLLHFP